VSAVRRHLLRRCAAPAESTRAPSRANSRGKTPPSAWATDDRVDWVFSTGRLKQVTCRWSAPWLRQSRSTRPVACGGVLLASLSREFDASSTESSRLARCWERTAIDDVLEPRAAKLVSDSAKRTDAKSAKGAPSHSQPWHVKAWRTGDYTQWYTSQRDDIGKPGRETPPSAIIRPVLKLPRGDLAPERALLAAKDARRSTPGVVVRIGSK